MLSKELIGESIRKDMRKVYLYQVEIENEIGHGHSDPLIYSFKTQRNSDLNSIYNFINFLIQRCIRETTVNQTVLLRDE